MWSGAPARFCQQVGTLVSWCQWHSNRGLCVSTIGFPATDSIGRQGRDTTFSEACSQREMPVSGTLQIQPRRGRASPRQGPTQAGLSFPRRRKGIPRLQPPFGASVDVTGEDWQNCVARGGGADVRLTEARYEREAWGGLSGAIQLLASFWYARLAWAGARDRAARGIDGVNRTHAPARVGPERRPGAGAGPAGARLAVRTSPAALFHSLGRFANRLILVGDGLQIRAPIAPSCL
jgi:hypothetical protein